MPTRKCGYVKPRPLFFKDRGPWRANRTKRLADISRRESTSSVAVGRGPGVSPWDCLGNTRACPEHKARSYGMPATCACPYISLKLRALLKPGIAQRHNQTSGTHSHTGLFTAGHLYHEDFLCSQQPQEWARPSEPWV